MFILFSSFFKVLAKKRDPVTHVCFLDEVQRHSNSDLFTRVWRNITRILTEEFAKAAQGELVSWRACLIPLFWSHTAYSCLFIYLFCSLFI